MEKVGSLKQAKMDVGVDNINKSTIIVIGGHISAGSIFAAKASCLTIVEIGYVVAKQ